MFRFFISLLSVALILFLIVRWGVSFGLWVQPSMANAILGALASLTGIMYTYLYRIKLKRPEIFNTFYLLSIALKLVAGLCLIGVILWLDSESIGANAALFLIAYSCFTFLEVYFLVERKG